ncbi:MAG: hypothetical protein ABR973_01495 [Candidatus Acidiferrales bacterium]|jgi:hypothetical protein
MEKAIVGIAACVLFSALSLAAQQEQTFKGEITDSMCSGPGGHEAMLKKGEAIAQCTISCVKMGAKYVLSNPGNKTVYKLDDQMKPEAFAGQNVVVIGTLAKTTGTIHVSDMIRALPPKVTQAKSVYIDCAACPRGMAAASQAALQELADWKRFHVLPDPHKADLIFLFSANPYLGDYLTRDGPYPMPVSIKITFMNVIDPGTGESLWTDYRRWGSWRVGGAAKDLIVEFRAQLEAEEGHVERLLSLKQDLNANAPRNESK